jgi:transcriptional regulator with XRE-family HTH domain
MVGYNIKKLIVNQGMTQTQLADALGISNGTLSDWIKGRYYPRHKYLVAMSEVFGVSVDDITRENDTVSLDEKMRSLFNSLSEEKQKQTIEYMRFLLHQRKG